MGGTVRWRSVRSLGARVERFLADRFSPRGTGADQIRRFQGRLWRTLALRDGLRFAVAWLLVWGCTVVVLRAAFLVDRTLLLWGAVGLLVAAVAGALVAVVRTPHARVARAVLDGRARLGGLLMAAGDVDVGRWAPTCDSIPLAEVRWRPGRLGLLLAGSSAFLAAALLAPDRYLPPRSPSALRVDEQIGRLAEKIRVLEQEPVVPPERARALERDVERAGREALGRDPAKTLEAIDHLEQSLAKAAVEAAEAAVQQTEAASRAQELAEGLEKAQGLADAKMLGAAMKQLAQMVDQAAADNGALSESLSQELKDACQQGALTEAELAELGRALGECKECQRAKIVKLIRARLIDPDMLIRCDEAGECDAATICEGLCRGKDAARLAVPSGRPGRGGITRGRADAAMTWSAEAEKGDATFKEKVLSPAALSIGNSRLAGVSVGDPTAARPGGPSARGALGSARAGGGEAAAQIILPEHEKTVRRYFEREKK